MYYSINMVQDQFQSLFHQRFEHVLAFLYLYDLYIEDAHIYVNQIDGIKEQLNRYETKGSLPAPELWLNPDITNFYDFDPTKDVKLNGYEHMGKISFPLAQ